MHKSLLNSNAAFFAKSAALALVLLLALLAALPFSPASAAPLAAAAVDGDGLMTVSPTSVTYGDVSTFVFTFTANNDFGTGSQVAITIPTGWTAPTTAPGAGNITWSSGTCTLAGAPPVAVTLMVIFIDMTSCLTGQSFTVTYAGVKAAAVSGSPYRFLTQTDIGPGGAGLVPIIAGSPTVTVNPKNLTVNSSGLTPANKVYDGTTVATLTIGSPGLAGIVGTDDVTLITSGATGAFADKNVGTAKTVNISGLTLGGTTAGNYTLTQLTRKANITVMWITITAVTDSKTYDGTTGSTGVPLITTGALQGSDTATWMQTFNNKNASTGKVLSPSGLVNDGNSGANYHYTYTAVSTGTINQRPVTLTAATDTKVYDVTINSTGTPTLSAGTQLAPGDPTPVWTQTFDNKNTGTNKVLTPAGKVIDGNSGNNYLYTYVTNSTGVITAKPLTVSAAGLTPANKIYDGTTAASLTVGSPTLVGVVSPDVVTLVTAGVAGAFADRNYGTGKTVNISGLTLGGAGAGNYTLTQPTRTANIARRPVTVTAITDSKVYDGTTSSTGVPALSVSTPLATGDNEPVWTQTFNSKNAGTTKTLTPAGLVNDGNGGANYTYTYATVNTGTITKKPITVTAVADARTYDGTTNSTGTPTLSGGTPLAPGDTEPVWTQAFDNKNVGTGKILTPAGTVNDGNGGNNYATTLTPNTNGTITSRAITVTASTDTKVYDGTTNSSAAPGIAPGLFGTDTSGFTQTFDNANAGTNKSITPSGTVNDGNSGLNYSISFAPAITTGVISAKPVTVTAAAKVKAFGAADPALTFTVLPPLLGTDGFSGALTRTTGESPGLYAITQGTLIAGANYNINYVGANLTINPLISGNIGLSSATLLYTDGTSKTAVADGSGNYSFTVTYNWSGTVTPVKTGFTFTPAKQTYASVTTNQTGQDYAATTTIAPPLLISPAQNALVTTYTPYLNWSKASVQTGTTFDHYELQVATDSGFNALVLDKVTLTDINSHNYTLILSEALNPSTTYYWRVRAESSLGIHGRWSLVRNFRSPIAPPSLSSPADNENLLYNLPTFTWTSVTNASGYTIQIAKNTAFTSLVLTAPVTGGTNTQYTPATSLPANMPLYWRVHTDAPNGPSPWTTFRTINTANPPSVPVLVAPVSNALTTNYQPLLNWAIVISPSFGHYEIQVTNTLDFSSLVIDDSSITDIYAHQFTPASPLNPNSLYRWRVRAYNSLGQYSNWSLVRTFRTALLPPTPSSPADAANLLNKRPTFTWSTVPFATGYTLQVSKNLTFTSLVGTYQVAPATYTPAADLPANTTLWWRVQSKGANGPSTWSLVRSFHTGNPPSVPTLILPATNALTTDYTPRLDWGLVTLPLGVTFGHYQVQVDDNADFSSMTVDQDVSGITNHEYTPSSDLAPNTRYYWRVRSYNADGEYSAWSLVRTFRTALSAPTLLSPGDTNTITLLRPAFDWADVSGATSYTIQVSKNITFTSLVVNKTVVPSTYMPTVNLPANITLYWRVKANGINGPSLWSSPVWSFTITP